MRSLVTAPLRAETGPMLLSRSHRVGLSRCRSRESAGMPSYPRQFTACEFRRQTRIYSSLREWPLERTNRLSRGRCAPTYPRPPGCRRGIRWRRLGPAARISESEGGADIRVRGQRGYPSQRAARISESDGGADIRVRGRRGYPSQTAASRSRRPTVPRHRRFDVECQIRVPFEL